MTGLLALVAGVAIVDSVNPATIVPALYLAAGRRPARGVLAFALGFLLVNVAGGAVVLGVGRRAVEAVPWPPLALLHWGELAVGAGAMAAAGVLWRRRHRLGGAPSRAGGRAHRLSGPAGAAIAAIELPTAFPYLAVIAVVAGSAHGMAVQAGLLVLFNLLFLAPVLAIWAALTFAGPRTGAMLDRVRGLALRHAGSATACLVLILGTALAILGASGVA